MKRWKKALAFAMCLCLLMEPILGAEASGTAADFERQGTEYTAQAQGDSGTKTNAGEDTSGDVSGNASGEASGDASGNASGNASGDSARTTEQAPAADRFLIQRVEYWYAQVTAGQQQSIWLYADTALERIANQQIQVLLRCDSDASTVSADLTYHSGLGAFTGTLAVTETMSKGVYRLAQVQYTAVGNGQLVEFAVTDTSLGSFEKTDAPNTAVQKIVLSATSLTLKEGASRTLTASVLPENATDSGVSWTSSNTKLATVTAQGLVLAHKKGTVTITATAKDGSGVTATCKVKIEKNLVIVLDPGHGASDVGAVNRSQGLYERNINLQIAKACRNYLEKYEGVTVFLTRETNQGFLGLAGRAKFAKACDADVLISLHINASGYRGSKGAEVWVTRSTYKAGYHKAMKALGKKILNNLGDCGMVKRGVFTRKSSCLRYSFDGSIADYYGVIRESIYRDIPAMIVEHGYIDSSDYQKMNTNAKTKKLGVADAKAIASYYGLKKREDTSSVAYVSGIKLNCNETSLTLKKGKTYQLKAVIAPKIAADKSVTYTSSKPSVASVGSAGKIKAKKKGTTTIRCQAKDGSGTVRTLKVVVK